MNENTAKAKKILEESDAVLVLCNGDEIISYNSDSVENLVSLCSSGKDFYGWSAAVRFSGRASAFLFVYLEVSEVYSQKLLKLSVNVLDRAEIAYFSDEIVESAPSADFEKFETAVIRSGSAVSAFQDIKRVVG